MTKKKSKIGFSVLDVLLLVLAAVCVLSFVFRDQIRGFLSGDEGVEIEYTFLIQNASEQARNCPEKGEELFYSKDLSSLGVLTRVASAEKEYHDRIDEEEEETETIKIKTLTCSATTTAKMTERGYVVGNTVIKPGAELQVETENDSFVMIVTMVRTLEE